MLKLTVGDWHKVSKPSSWCLIKGKLAKEPPSNMTVTVQDAGFWTAAL